MQTKQITIILSLILLFWVGEATQAQGLPFKGYAGGGLSIGFQNNESETNKSTSQRFGLNPSIGFAISNRWTMGVGLGVSYTRYRSESLQSYIHINTNTSVSYSLIQELRHYTSLIEDKLYLFIQFDTSLGLGNNRNKQTTGSDTNENQDRFQGFSLRVSPNLAYFISQKWALEVGLSGFGAGYQWGENNSQFSIGLAVSSLSPTFGFRYYW